jgi:DNA-binding XRE family transcriptional regulator
MKTKILCAEQVAMKNKNRVKAIRESRLLSKSELARKAGVSVLTIARIERGEECRMETMRKIILALGYNLEDKTKVFQDQE